LLFFRRVHRFKLLLLISLLLVISLEVYAHLYVPSLPIIPREDTKSYMPYANGTENFGRSWGGCSVEWLVAWEYKKEDRGTFRVYLFKVAREGNLFVYNLETVPINLKTKVNNVPYTGVYALLDEVFYGKNFTLALIEYDVGFLGTFNVTFNLFVRTYARTLIGYLPIEETMIVINATFYNP